MKKVIFIGFLFCCAFSVKAQNNLILNGSFETNSSPQCYYDMNTSDWNTTVNFTTSFGGNTALLNDSCPGCNGFPSGYWGGGSQEGNWLASLRSFPFSFPVGNGWNRSMFSFHLSDTLSSLKNYKLSFYIKEPPVPPVITPTCHSVQKNSKKKRYI